MIFNRYKITIMGSVPVRLPLGETALKFRIEGEISKRKQKATTVEAFAEAFDLMRDIPEVAGNIKKFGNRYYGIKLLDTKVAKLPLPRRERK